MKASKRNLENEAREQERLAKGKPLLSKYEQKNMSDEQYQEAIAKHRELMAKRGIVRTK